MSPLLADNFIAPPCNEDIQVLSNDGEILLINKPSGLLSLSGKNPQNKDSVHHRLVQDFPSATLLHRLDFGTSGIMLVALNKAVNGALTRQFQSREIHKTYTAILHGSVQEDHGVIDLPIAKDKPNFPLVKVCFETGKPAQSEFVVLERLDNPQRTRVRFTPLTGRTHQLRVHSQQVGHSIVGCDLYGSPVDKKADKAAGRLMLHATSIAFRHPISDKTIKVDCPPPF